MTKAVLYYALRGGCYGSPSIVGVTSEKPGRYFGHTIPYHAGTHGVSKDLIGRFKTLKAAEAKVAIIKAIKERHKPLIEAAQNASQQAYRAEREEIKSALNDA